MRRTLMMFVSLFALASVAVFFMPKFRTNKRKQQTNFTRPKTPRGPTRRTGNSLCRTRVQVV